MAKYTASDMGQAVLGVFSAILLFIALRTEPVGIDPELGVLITALWVYVFYKGNGIPKTNFLAALAVTFVVSGIMCFVFGLVTEEQLFSFQYFGSTAIVGVWIGFPIALVLDKYNISNILKRYK